jgi:predicted phosphodiesterase
MTQILHTADVHLDRSFSGLGMSQGIAAGRRQELRDAVRRFVDMALEAKADVVTVAGDLYEHERATLDTGNFLRRQFQRLAPAPVLIAPGNHDPYLPGSLYHRVEWPDNVTIFAEPRFTPFSVGCGLTIWGAGHDGPALRQNLLDGFRVSGEGRHVLLFHGSDANALPAGKAAHCPFFPQEVQASGADFALLGHYHGARLYPPHAPVLGYPGTPEPLDFSEAGSHFILRLEIGRPGINAELVPFGEVSYATHYLDVTPMLTSDQVRESILGLAGAAAITRVVLEGEAHPELDLDLRTLYGACAERFGFLDIVDRTQPGYRLDELAEESTTKGAFVRLMQSRIERLQEEHREIAEQALRYGLRAFDRRELNA